MQARHNWIHDLQRLLVHGENVVLVTVARTEGAVPRGAGSKMIIARDRAYHSIGGGALEWRAIESGRQLLREGADAGRRLERLSLMAYHYGVVTLAYERLSIADLGWVSALARRFTAGQASVRSVTFADNSPVLLSESTPAAAEPDCLLWDAGPLLTETIVPRAFPVFVFGAGHVGAALIQVLGTLSCEVTWIDDRPEQMAARLENPLPANVIGDLCEDPVARVAQAPAGCSFVVLTYSDTLDQALALRILLRSDFAYFGMIGTHAKRRVMTHWLATQGIDPALSARMHCPIGIAAVEAETPETLAVAIAAQLLSEQAKRGPTHGTGSEGRCDGHGDGRDDLSLT